MYNKNIYNLKSRKEYFLTKVIMVKRKFGMKVTKPLCGLHVVVIVTLKLIPRDRYPWREEL